ncbi:hypothetical protein ACHWQZ_G018376 [Mnemiopsis leidyi]
MEIQDQNVYVVSEDPAKVQDSTTLSSEPGLNFTTDSKAVLTKVHLGGADKVDKQKKFGVVEEDNLEQLRPFLPTLPQLFIFLVWTEFLINFVRFIAICTVDSLSVAYTSTAGEMTAVKVRNGFLATGQEWFQITSWGILVVFIAAIYAQLYKQEIAPPQDHIPSRVPTVALPVPTIPRLFAMLSLTQVAVNFFRFVAIGDEKSGYAFLAPAENWFQVGSWIVFLLMNMVSLTYMFYLHQQIKPAVTETLFFSFTFLALFEAPLTTSSSSRDYQATFTFFRGICILLISGMYAVVHRQEIVPLPSFGFRDGPRKEGENGGTDQKL